MKREKLLAFALAPGKAPKALKDQGELLAKTLIKVTKLQSEILEKSQELDAERKLLSQQQRDFDNLLKNWDIDDLIGGE